MFTPPPSPRPVIIKDPMSSITFDEKHLPIVPSSAVDATSTFIEDKRKIGRRLKWTFLFAPLVLIIITMTSRHITQCVGSTPEHSPPNLDSALSQLAEWSISHPPIDHELFQAPTPVKRATATGAQSLPTIPATPPVLPTPFPQPFETLGQNFSSASCYNFIVNMTATLPFRSCRSFALLLQSSSDFIQLQENYTALNTVMWGTCNTDVSSDQCVSNMGWFASALQTSCSQDLSDRNSVVVNTLQALKAYEVMRQTGCSSDPTTNTYCYMNAVFNSNPSDLYFYQLPLGNALPKDTSPTCSACTKSIMAAYAVALKQDEANLSGLQATYPNAAKLAISECGIGYAPTLESSTSNGVSSHAHHILALVATAFVACMTVQLL